VYRHIYVYCAIFFSHTVLLYTSHSHNILLNMSQSQTEAGELSQEQTANVANTAFVKLIVGEAMKEIIVKEDILCAKCPFFHSAFAGNFIEAKTKTITFPDDEPEDFDDLILWVKSGKILPGHFDPTWLQLSKLWLFADKYYVDDLQNGIVDAINAKFSRRISGVNISFETLDYVAEHTSDRSPLRRLFADILTNGIPLQHLPSQVTNIPAEFLQEMVVQMKTAALRHDPTLGMLLSQPVQTYYVSSAHSKATAMPAAKDKPEIITRFQCEGSECELDGEPIRNALYFCAHHGNHYCEKCGLYERTGHNLKLISFSTDHYVDKLIGENVELIDGHVVEDGFYCDGPACDIGQDQATHVKQYLMAGDRYNCLTCSNRDYCTVCIRRPLECKDEGHSMMRIRASFAGKGPLSETRTLSLECNNIPSA